MLRSILAGLTFIALAACSSQAPAQSTPLQGGPWTNAHLPMYSNSGNSQPVIQDSGPAGGGAVGLGASEQLLVARGTGTPPYASQGTGPLGTNWCDYDAPITNATGYHYLCLSANAQGGGLLAYNSGGGAAQLPLIFNINGAAYEFPAILSGIVGPSSSVINNFVCWNNTSGTLVKDCGFTTGTSGHAVPFLDGINTWSANQTIAKANPSLILNKALSGQQNIIYGQTNGLARWSVELGNTTSESGTNAGSNYALSRFDDAGASLGTPILITRSNGLIQFGPTTIPTTLSASVVQAFQTPQVVPFGGSFLNAVTSSNEKLTVTTTTGGPVFTHAITMQTDGGNANGPGHISSPLLIDNYKTNYLTSTADGELAGQYILNQQGRVGDGDGLLIGSFKVFSGTGSDTGSGIGIEVSTRAIDAVGTLTNDIHSVSGFQLSTASTFVGRNSVGFWAETQVGTSYASFAAVAGQDLGADTTYYFAGSLSRSLTPNFLIDNLGKITSTISTAGTFGLNLISTDAGAASANGIRLFRNSASPAVADSISSIFFNGNNTVAAEKTYAVQAAVIIDATSTSEDGGMAWFNVVAGSLVNELNLRQGLMVGAAAADEGAGTVNAATGYYTNGTAGVNCSGATTGSFAAIGGIVTHC